MSDKNVVYGLFCLCHPSDGIRYVGQTRVGMTARFGVHLAHAKTVQAPVYNWIRKHGLDNITYTILEVCLLEELDARESAWIDFYRAEQGLKLMNVKTGGSTSRGYKRPAQSERMKGENNPMWGLDRRDLMAHARSFQGPASEETRRKLSEARLGKKHTEESRQKMSDKANASWTEERKQRASKTGSGEGNNATNLTEDMVREIRLLREQTGESYAKIGARFGLTSNSASNICRRLTWKNVE